MRERENGEKKETWQENDLDAILMPQALPFLILTRNQQPNPNNVNCEIDQGMLCLNCIKLLDKI